MGLINHELAFDLEDLMELSGKTDILSTDLAEQRESLTNGLEQLRKDWNTDAGKRFFEQLDNSWEDEVEKFEKTLEVFKTILDNAVEEFEGVVDQANEIKVDFS